MVYKNIQAFKDGKFFVGNQSPALAADIYK